MSAHNAAQQEAFDARYGETRSYWFTSEPMTRYIILWRLGEAIRRFRRRAGVRFDDNGSVLFMCAGEGAEASVCMDNFGFKNVTFSDISPVAVQTGLRRDSRLKGIAADAEISDIPDESFDLVIVQDGLHHLRSPVKGFTEMLRIAKVGVIFLESHDVFVANLVGTKWERNGDAINFCFRWSKSMVEQVASSYLGRDRFVNDSFSSWHHNLVYARIGDMVGQGKRAVLLLRCLKFGLDHLLPGMGNMFAGIVVKTEPR